MDGIYLGARMSNLLRSPFTKIICCYLALVIAGILPGPMEARASFISHSLEITTELDAESLGTIRTVLENELITEKLSELGLTEEEVIQRIEQLDPKEREIVLEKLDSINSGGDGDPILALIIIIVLLPFILVGAILVGIYKYIDESYEKKVKKNDKATDKKTSFSKSQGIDLPPFEGNVKVYDEVDPEESFIYIGKVNLRTSSAITKEKRNKIFLKWMKREASENGADVIILLTVEPVPGVSRSYYWSARAYRTLEGETLK